MTRPISEDLRRRVIEYIELGNNCAKAAKKFDISYSSAHRWHRRYKTTGTYKAIPYPGKKAKVKSAEFIKYVDSHPSATLAQIGSNFGISAKAAHYYMKKLGYSYKKKSLAIWKQRNNREENIKNK